MTKNSKQIDLLAMNVTWFPKDFEVRYHPRYFDLVGHLHILKISIFSLNHVMVKTYQNYEQPHQSLQNLYFQSHFSASKITEYF